MRSEVARFIAAYRKSDDEESGRYRLRGLPPGFLQGLYGESRENPMYDVYPTDHGRLAALRKFVVPMYELVKRPWDLARFDYFLEAEVESGPSADRDFLNYYGKTYVRKRLRRAVEAGGAGKWAGKS